MKNTTTPDKRPAIAFSNAKEVQMVLDALRAYRIDHVSDSSLLRLDLPQEFISRLEDEFTKVLNMFNSK